MGVCQQKNRSVSNTYSTKAVRKPPAFPNIDFYFSTQSLIRIDTQALVLFTDLSFSLKKNPFLSRVNARDVRQITQLIQSFTSDTYAQIYETKQPCIQYPAYLQQLGFVSVPLSDTSLRFKRVMVISIDTWNGHKDNELKLKSKYQMLFEEVEKLGITSVAITECNPIFGIPLGVAIRSLFKGIQSSSNSPLKMVTMVCLEEGVQNILIEETSGWKVNPANSFITTQSVSNSVYY